MPGPTSTTEPEKVATFRTQVVDVLDAIDEYVEDSGDLHDDVIDDAARQLGDQDTTIPTSTSAVASTTSSIAGVQTRDLEERAPIVLATLQSGIERVNQSLELLDPGTDEGLRADVMQLTSRMDALHVANVELLSSVTEDAESSGFPWWIFLLLAGIGLGFIILWRRRWVSIDAEACTACGTCTTQASRFFVGDSLDARAYMVERDASNGIERRHRIRMPWSRRSRRLVRAMIKACETDAIKLTIRRRADDSRLDSGRPATNP
jgi:ferredoxin